MRKALALSLFVSLLGGCASDPAKYDINGVWINQAAIDATAKGGNLREALQTYGPNLEWDIDTSKGQADYSNGFERGEGKLTQEKPGSWKVDFYGGSGGSLTREGKQLIQSPMDSDPQQSFIRPPVAAGNGAPLGASFEEALYSAYMGGSWKIVSGPGAGNRVRFQSNGQVTGLPNADRYALCMAGDCASMSGGNDSIWLQQGQQGSPWIFVRRGQQLEIFQALNSAQMDEMPQLYPGNRQWLLEKQ